MAAPGGLTSRAGPARQHAEANRDKLPVGGPTDQKGDAMATSPWPLIHAEREGLAGDRNGLATLRSRS